MPVVPRKKKFKAKISGRTVMKHLRIVWSTLKGESASKFKASCLGHLWGLALIQFQGQLMLHLLYQRDTDHDGEGLKFEVGNKVASFGMKKCAAISGLKFGEVTHFPEQSLLHHKVFEGCRGITVNDLRDAYVKWAVDEKGDGDTTLKLALLWVLHGVLISKGGTKPINMDYFHVVDHLDLFNQFPWGTVVFHHLCDSTKTALLDKDGKPYKGGDRVVEFNYYGFTHLLQVWAYEAIPDLRNLCCEELPNSEGILPRLLRWKVSKQPEFGELRTLVFGKKRVDVDVQLRVPDREMEQPYMQWWQGWVNMAPEERAQSLENLEEMVLDAVEKDREAI